MVLYAIMIEEVGLSESLPVQPKISHSPFSFTEHGRASLSGVDRLPLIPPHLFLISSDLPDFFRPVRWRKDWFTL